MVLKAGDEEASLDILNSIQTDQKDQRKRPYPPLFWPPSSLMTNKQSLDLCTESLGSETGSDGFISVEEFYSYFHHFTSKRDSFEEEKQGRRNELTTVKCKCSIGRASQPLMRSFPPPLSSTFIQMRPLRRNGHLILEAVSVPFHSYLHAERLSGRLVLSFISRLVEEEEEEDNDEEEGEEEEEIQVVDREAVVEVKVSEQPQVVNGIAAVKVLRSSLVVKKFVVGAPLAEDSTAAAAAAVGMSTSDGFQYNLCNCSVSGRGARGLRLRRRWRWRWRWRRLLFRSKRRSRVELRRPHFIFEQRYCIPTSPAFLLTLRIK